MKSKRILNAKSRKGGLVSDSEAASPLEKMKKEYDLSKARKNP